MAAKREDDLVMAALQMVLAQRRPQVGLAQSVRQPIADFPL